MTIITQNKPSQGVDFESKKDLVKRLFCKGGTDDEFELFMHACKRTGLDPFMKQIYAIKRGGAMTIQTGIDGLRLIAERTGRYSPGRESSFAYDDKGGILAATSYIKKRTDDGTWHEVAAVAYMEEYNAKQGLWSKMPRAMLSKCAEALALRKAFPSEMSGLYSQEEMDQADTNAKPTERMNISDEEWARLDMLVDMINNEERIKKLASAVDAESIHEIHPKHYDRVIRTLEKAVKQLEVPVEQERMA